MASACLNNVGISTEIFLDRPSCTPYDWLNPRISFGGDLIDDETKISGKKPITSSPTDDLIDFEFCLDDPVLMLPADELFSGGKLVPLRLPSPRPASDSSAPCDEIVSPVEPARSSKTSRSDPFPFSPKAPSCSSRWREILGLKRGLNSKTPTVELRKSASLPWRSSKALKHFLLRNTKAEGAKWSTSDAESVSLLRDSDSELVSIYSQKSLPDPDHEDASSTSLDSERQNTSLNQNLPRIAVSKPQCSNKIPRPLDSPRMNSSGKIVFHSLGRSSSSPSSFHGGSRNIKHRGVERSYPENVRVGMVLNVPVFSLRGSSRKDGAARSQARVSGTDRS